MASVRAPTKTWTAREGTFYLARYPMVAFNVGTELSGVFNGITGDSTTSGITIQAATKNITITPPETAWEKQDLLGKDSSNFQNQLLDEKPVGMATITATLVLGEDETVSDYVMSGTASGASGYTRYQIGNDKTSSNRVITCVTLKSNTLGESVAFGLEDARVTKWGDVRVSGPDSHWEQDVTITSLAKNFYWEFKD